MNAESSIAAKAVSLGFDAVGFTTPDIPDEARQGLQEFLINDHHGDMGWMAEKSGRRGDPKTLWPEAKSVIVVGHNYGPDFDPMEKLQQKNSGNISCYALNEDYHDVIKKKLKALARWVAEEFSCEVKVFVDTAPVMEKTLAAEAGIGWQGKHTCLVSREFGSWLFLGCVFVNLPLEGGGREATPSGWGSAETKTPTGSATLRHLPLPGGGDLCGTCQKCMDVCPTHAFTAERKLDARRCISYLTIEHKGQIPLEFRKAIGNRIYGCDDCLAVCPWNKFAKTSGEIAYHPREALQAPLLADLAQLDDASFRALFKQSPVKRIGRDRFVRNVLVAIGNSEDASLHDVAATLMQDASLLVSEMAAWAVEELSAGAGAGVRD